MVYSSNVWKKIVQNVQRLDKEQCEVTLMDEKDVEVIMYETNLMYLSTAPTNSITPAST